MLGAFFNPSRLARRIPFMNSHSLKPESPRLPLIFCSALAFTLLLICAFALISYLSPRASSNESAGVFAIVGATVVDGTGAAPVQATVLVRDGRIAAVGRDVTVPSDARIIRAEGQTLLPGLFDLHTHLPYATAPNITADWPKNLKAYLYCGVTSVVDFGTYPETFAPMRRLAASGAIDAPRLHLAARMTTPGGHGAEGGRGDFFTLEVLTPREARAAVRRLLPYKPDVIKVFTDGWRYNTAPDMTSMNEETLAAIVDEAHKSGIEVMTHTVTLERAKIAARAGVDVLAHGVGDREADDELIRLLKTKGTTYVSTLAVYEPRGRDILTPLLAAVLEPAVRERITPPLTAPLDDNERAPIQQQPVAPQPSPATAQAENTRAQNEQSAREKRWHNLLHNIHALSASGIALGAGTDAGVTGTHHGWATLRELQLLVAGGITPMQAIVAATSASARALHVEGERGTIAVGKLADLLLVEGAPHQNIGDIKRTTRVFLGGREIDRDKLARDIASAEQTPLAAVKIGERVDDFEGTAGDGVRARAGASAKENANAAVNTAGDAAASATTASDLLRSRLDTLWVNATDSGQDHSQILLARTLRQKDADHALSILTRMSNASRPYVRASVPLAPGAVEPADLRGFRGVRFDARGDGSNYRLIIPTRAVRDSAYFQTDFQAGAKWQTVRIDFAALKQEQTNKPVAWTGSDLLMLTFEVARPPGSSGWLELDNISFYK